MKRDRNIIDKNLEELNNKRRSHKDEKKNQNKDISFLHGDRPSQIGPSISHLGNVPLSKKKWEERMKVGKKKKKKNKLVAYKLQLDFEVATDLERILDERMLNAKIEFTLQEISEIITNEFYDIIIDIIN